MIHNCEWRRVHNSYIGVIEELLKNSYEIRLNGTITYNNLYDTE